MKVKLFSLLREFVHLTKVTQLGGTWALSGENWGMGRGCGTDGRLIKTGAQSPAHKIGESRSGSGTA